MLTIEDAVARSQLNHCIRVIRRTTGQTMIESPFHYPDGDHYPIYVTETGTGGFVLSDGGHTLMRLSYENDIDKLLTGARWLLLEQVVAQEEAGYNAKNGSFYVEIAADQVVSGVFRLGQTLTRVFSLIFLNRSKVESTFYEDLYGQILSVVSEDRVDRDYRIPALPEAGNYPVDFRLEAKTPLFIYGIPGRDKARLTTIFLQYFITCEVPFNSLLVFADQSEIPRADLARLSNVGGEMIATLNASTDFRRKLSRQLQF